MSNLFVDSGSSGRKVMLATTAYDSPDASYTFSIARTREALHHAGLPTAYVLLQGNCHVDDARNTVVRDFLASDCTDLVFLDADVSWTPDQLVKLCRYDCDVVGGVYPYRRETGRDSMPVRNLRGVWEPDENGLLEVEGLPTGFLRIRRHVLEKMADEAEVFEKNGPVPLLFERRILNGGRLGGDIGFCMKWRAMGGRVYAAANLRLGHCGKHIVKDSLAASMRRQAGTTLAHVAEAIREGEDDHELLAEAIRAANNPWGACEEVLGCAVALARKAGGPIIEAGSGLSTVLMAAATDQTVWCLEHDSLYAHILQDLARKAGVGNIALVTAPVEEGWYAIAPEDRAQMPKRFACAFVDGPPRLIGDRMKFFEEIEAEAILADDADDRDYSGRLKDWADANGYAFERGDFRSAFLKRKGDGA